MTRENKPDWHSKWLEIHTEFLTAEKLPTTLNTGSIQGQRMIIDEDIAKFIDVIGICNKCPDYKPKERVLNPDIKEFFDNCCRMEKLK